MRKFTYAVYQSSFEYLVAKAMEREMLTPSCFTKSQSSLAQRFDTMEILGPTARPPARLPARMNQLQGSHSGGDDQSDGAKGSVAHVGVIKYQSTNAVFATFELGNHFMR
jgi:hypothetical protein